MIENYPSPCINCCVGEHVCSNLIRMKSFMWFVKLSFYQHIVQLLGHYWIKRNNFCDLKLAFQGYLCYPNQYIYYNKVFYNGRKTIWPCFKIIHFLIPFFSILAEQHFQYDEYAETYLLAVLS